MKHQSNPKKRLEEELQAQKTKETRAQKETVRKSRRRIGILLCVLSCLLLCTGIIMYCMTLGTRLLYCSAAMGRLLRLYPAVLLLGCVTAVAGVCILLLTRKRKPLQMRPKEQEQKCKDNTPQNSPQKKIPQDVESARDARRAKDVKSSAAKIQSVHVQENQKQTMQSSTPDTSGVLDTQKEQSKQTQPYSGQPDSVSSDPITHPSVSSDSVVLSDIVASSDAVKPAEPDVSSTAACSAESAQKEASKKEVSQDAVCPACGSKGISPGDRFCLTCGAPLFLPKEPKTAVQTQKDEK